MSAVSPPIQNHFSASRHETQLISKAEEPISSYLANLNQPPKRNTFNSSNSENKSIMSLKRKSLGKVIDRLLSKVFFSLTLL